MGSPGSGQGISPEACGIVGPCRNPLLVPFHSSNCTPSCKPPGPPPHKDFLPVDPMAQHSLGCLHWAGPLSSNTLSVTYFCFTNCAATSWFRAAALCLPLTLRSGRQVGLSRESCRALGLPTACWPQDPFTARASQRHESGGCISFRVHLGRGDGPCHLTVLWWSKLVPGATSPESRGGDRDPQLSIGREAKDRQLF